MIRESRKSLVLILSDKVKPIVLRNNSISAAETRELTFTFINIEMKTNFKIYDELV